VDGAPQQVLLPAIAGSVCRPAIPFCAQVLSVCNFNFQAKSKQFFSFKRKA